MSKETLTDGSPVTADHREINPTTGLQHGYVVLSAEERAKGFVRPVRRSYVHTKCGVVTMMDRAIAETYARQPDFYKWHILRRMPSAFPPRRIRLGRHDREGWKLNACHVPPRLRRTAHRGVLAACGMLVLPGRHGTGALRSARAQGGAAVLSRAGRGPDPVREC